jgi:hypothetical protein
VRLRISDEYQGEAALRRERNWEELLNWICFRSYRYLGQRGIKILDFGNRYAKLAEKIENSDFCLGYELRDTIIDYNSNKPFSAGEQADVILNINNLQQTVDPLEDINRIAAGLRKGGLMFFSARIGTGFDILTMREHSKVFPFEHVFLPSMDLLTGIFNQAGFKVLEVSTPGTLDVIFVKENKEFLNEEESFIKYMMDGCPVDVLQDFQRFLQKSGLSSYAQIVARKELD